MSDASKDTAAAAPEVAPTGASMPMWPVFVLVGALIIGGAVWFKWFHVSSTDDSSEIAASIGSSRVIVIDTARIIAAATKKVLDTPNANPTEEGGKLSVKLSSVMDEYRKAGALILNGYTVIYCPPDMDKTAEVAEKVGVKLE